MKNNQEFRKKEIIVAMLFIIILIAGGFFAGLIFGKKKNPETNNSAKNETEEIRQSGYEFINPLLECEMVSNDLVYAPFEKEVKSKELKMMNEKYSDVEFSLYFRNLQNGPWFGINERSNFSPASLMKVPVMIAYFKNAEKNPEILKQQIVYQDFGLNKEMIYQPKKTGEEGKSYSVDELINFMIIGSDNNALTLLFKYMDENSFNTIFSDLEIPMPDMHDSNNVITVKDYASFFRILYNASYLNREMSEKSLELLSQVEYKDALRSAVPENIKVAHKFGERTSLQEENFSRQLHDCGIVYYDGYNYLICIMTRGSDFNQLSNAIAEMGKIVYDEVDKNMKK